MNEKRQIEEMAQDMYDLLPDYEHNFLDCRAAAEEMFARGYHRHSEGKWEIVVGSNGREKMVCTNCQHQQDLASTFTYCPNCGARMRGSTRK